MTILTAEEKELCTRACQAEMLVDLDKMMETSHAGKFCFFSMSVASRDASAQITDRPSLILISLTKIDWQF